VVIKDLPLGDDTGVLVVVLAVRDEARDELPEGEDPARLVLLLLSEGASQEGLADLTLVLFGTATGVDGRRLADALLAAASSPALASSVPA
jgi:hypothetical protein